MADTFTVTGGIHVECGSGPVVPVEGHDNIRLRCACCGAEETWEQIARAYKKELDATMRELATLRKIEAGIDSFIKHLKGGYY